MAPSKIDASYPFVSEANRKEALNSRRRLEREERAKNPNPWWNLVTAGLLAGVTAMHADSGNKAMTAIFAILTICHLFLTYGSWRKRRSSL
ncbi:MAG: hypothetical protein AAFQ64_17170 [Pseudomonadota bacterium]